MSRDAALYVISVAARLVDMHPNTLRKYEREGFLVPARSDGNLRLYSAADIARLRQIKRLVEEHGVNLAGVELLLELGEEIRRLRDEASQADEDPAARGRAVGRCDRLLARIAAE